MQASLTREGRDVGVFIMTRDGKYTWDCSKQERDRFNPIIEKIIEDLREPYAPVGRGATSPSPSSTSRVIPAGSIWYWRDSKTRATSTSFSMTANSES
jgi:hypothetical protein